MASDQARGNNDATERAQDGPTSGGDVDVDADSANEEPPYEFWYEVGYFFRNGVPLGISAILTWGFPPFFALISESFRALPIRSFSSER